MRYILLILTLLGCPALQAAPRCFNPATTAESNACWNDEVGLSQDRLNDYLTAARERAMTVLNVPAEAFDNAQAAWTRYKVFNAATYASSGAMRRLGRQRQQAASSTSTISGRTIYGNTISPMSTARRRSGPNLRCVLANDIAATRWRICHADRLVTQLHAQKNGDLIDRSSCSSARSVAHTARCVDQQVNSLPRRSPMITHGAMVLPVVTRGMMEASAIRNPSMP
ncbi:hypothetical protein NCPPB940_43990 [Xanthomonas hortorum pv. taraxaci]|nr:hypothetical protein NCPPB940_43990 [Xanthomonas hortorum pv. taraxaci]CAD0359745.1 hypothetical protein NCPPB940_43990 [Xanthomonas hortorum pv. taraxaci]